MSAPGTLQASLLGRCPKCGQGRLFDGYLSIAPECSVCGQNFRSFDVGDGAAALVILVVGAIVCGLALWVEFTFSPPLWVHAVLWTPVIALLTLFFLRVTKAALLVLQYQHKAGEGRIVG
ncbi:MAG TPA: DUF983 domain-containing protein [Rhizomicrobium sp.]|nr:DUF983 domain-containing protein [Rhizomicrobium sp.]